MSNGTSSFKTHASRKHHSWQHKLITSQVGADLTSNAQTEGQQAVSTSQTSSNVQHEPVTDETMDFSPTVQTYAHSSDHSIETSKLSPEETAALFLLSYKEKFKLSQRAIDYAIGSVNSIAESVCDTIKARFHQKGSSFTMTDVEECCEYSDPFKNLTTEYLQTKYYKEHFALVVS